MVLAGSSCAAAQITAGAGKASAPRQPLDARQCRPLIPLPGPKGRAASRQGLVDAGRRPLLRVTASLGDSMFHAGNASYYAYQSMASVFVAAGLTVWFGRPMGSSASCIEVRDSGVHGKGVFAKEDIPAGTALGTYPGVARSVPTMVAKAKSIPAAKDYVFVSEAGVPLDPTDDQGQLSEWPEGSFWPFADDITLARMNEPMPGGMVSVTAETDDDDSKKVVFIATRDIEKGEEIFIDYGPKFDRSGYGPR